MHLCQQVFQCINVTLLPCTVEQVQDNVDASFRGILDAIICTQTSKPKLGVARGLCRSDRCCPVVEQVQDNLEASFVSEAEMVFTTLSSTGRKVRPLQESLASIRCSVLTLRFHPLGPVLVSAAVADACSITTAPIRCRHARRVLSGWGWYGWCSWTEILLGAKLSHLYTQTKPLWRPQVFDRLGAARFETVLIDEAAQATELANLQAFAFGCKQCVFETNRMY